MLKLKRVENALLFLTILFLPTQLGRHFWPSFSFVYSLPIDYLSPAAYFWDLLVVVLIAVFILQNGKVNKTALNLWLLFILLQSFSLLPHLGESERLGPGLIRIEQYLVSGMFGVYLASINLKKKLAIIFWSLAGAVISQSVLAIAQFMKGATLGFWILGERSFSLSTPGIAKFDFYGRQFLRPYATFPHPNVLGGFLVVSAILLNWLKPSKPRIQSILSFLAGLIILLTVSRTSITAVLAGAALLLKGKAKVGFLILALLAAPILYVRFWAIFNFDSLSFIRREQLSEVAVKMWVSAPILGAGINNFIPQAADQILVGPSRFLQPVHNIFLLTLAETGLVGLLGLLGLLGVPIWGVLKLNPKLSTLPPVLLIWGIIVFLGLFDHYFLTLPQGYRLLFLVWGLSLGIISSTISTDESYS